MSINNHLPLILATLLLFVSVTDAFGAGNIPSYGYLENRAYRHGDIEDTLAKLVMRHASGFLSRSIKFTGLMVKQVLRDYSQAVDIGTLGRGIKLGTIRLLVWVLGFATFGYATQEFQVTNERLGTYRPEEHIDNPKGYGDGEDARRYDPRLRGPVNPRELEIDPRSGMKNYIANEQGGWATSAGYVRWSLERCIDFGRRHEAGKRDEDMYEAFRLLGQSLHTLEDFSAHSNYCELALIELGYGDVFPHVGSQTQIQLGGKRVYPLVTGTFGAVDFVHSLLGEASDHLLQTGVKELGLRMRDASSQSNDAILSSLLSQIPGQGSELNQRMRQITVESEQKGKSGFEDPEELASRIYPILEFRDRVMKVIETTIDRIPGLSALVEKIRDSLAVYVLSQLEPLIRPVITEITQKLGQGSSLVVSSGDQYAVWSDVYCTDPTHSMLSKDHFSAYLNQPAGLVAIAVVKFAVERVTRAWGDSLVSPRSVADEIVSAFHHPAVRDPRNSLQIQMFETMREWIGGMDNERRRRVLEGLTSGGVREGLNHDQTSSRMTEHHQRGSSELYPGSHPGSGSVSTLSIPSTVPTTSLSGYGGSLPGYLPREFGYQRPPGPPSK